MHVVLRRLHMLVDEHALQDPAYNHVRVKAYIVIVLGWVFFQVMHA